MPYGHAHVYAGHRITSRVYRQPKILLYMTATNCVSFLLSPKKNALCGQRLRAITILRLSLYECMYLIYFL